MVCKLFKALYSFSGSAEGTLSFEQNSLLTILQPVDLNWYFGCKNDSWGFVPKRYVEEVQNKDYNYMTRTINACIKKLQAIPKTGITKDEQSALKKLLKHRDALLAEQQQQQQKPNADTSTSTSYSTTSVASKPAVAAAVAAPAPAVISSLSRRLVDSVRDHTGASHAACEKAVRALLATLEDAAAAAASGPSPLIGQLLEHMAGGGSSSATSRSAGEGDECAAAVPGGGSGGRSDSSTEDWSERRDWQSLDKLLANAERRRRDWQERGGWSLHEREPAVLEELGQLADLLANADAALVRRRLLADGCAGPLCLAELHAAETRPAVRAALRGCLAAACALDRAVVDVLLGHSSLPADLMAERDGQLLPVALKLLAALFSSRLQPPSAVVEALNGQLFGRLLDLLGEDDCDPAVAQSIVTLALAANNLSCESLAATPVEERPLFAALLANPAASQEFTETLLLMYNRSEDPTALLEHSPPQCDSVLKMLTDLFSHESTAAVFYSNDICVLVDVICRELNNASYDSPRISPTLNLLQRCIDTVSYQDSFYKNGDLRKALQKLSEQDEAPDAVKSLSQSLFNALFSE